MPNAINVIPNNNGNIPTPHFTKSFKHYISYTKYLPQRFHNQTFTGTFLTRKPRHFDTCKFGFCYFPHLYKKQSLSCEYITPIACK